VPPKPAKGKRVGSADRKVPLPPGWVLPPEGRAYAANLGWSEARIAAQALRFQDHALKQGARYVNWAAAWRNWCTSPYQANAGVQNGNGKGNGFDREHRRARTGAAFAALQDYAEGGGGADPQAAFGFSDADRDA
jgi:hypothetical protein